MPVGGRSATVRTPGLPKAVGGEQAIVVGIEVHEASRFHHPSEAGMDRVLLVEAETLAWPARGAHRDPEQTSITQKG